MLFKPNAVKESPDVVFRILQIFYYLHTSTKSALHVESPRIIFEVLRSGFFCPIVQLANMFANDEIVALASDILAA